MKKEIFSRDAVADRIVEEIAGKGWIILDDLLPLDLVNELADEAASSWDDGDFRKAGVGIGANLQVRPEIRTDRVLWLDENTLTPIQQRYWNRITELRNVLNEAFFLGARGFEAHFAVYPEGSFYKKHLDQHKDVKHRVVTCILYLNDDWTEDDGGQLRIYNPENESEYFDFFPVKGRFACFRSDQVYHEVLPSRRERFSLTGWIRKGE